MNRGKEKPFQATTKCWRIDYIHRPLLLLLLTKTISNRCECVFFSCCCSVHSPPLLPYEQAINGASQHIFFPCAILCDAFLYVVCIWFVSCIARCVCVWWWWSWPALDTENVCVFCYCLLLLVAFDVCWFDYRLDRMCNRHQPSRLIPCTVGRPDYPQKHHIKVGAKRGHKWRKQKMNNEKKKNSRRMRTTKCRKRSAPQTHAYRVHTSIERVVRDNQCFTFLVRTIERDDLLRH